MAKAAKVPLRLLVSYEAHERAPTLDATVRSFARVLGFPVEFLYGPTLEAPPAEGTSFRALSSLTARQKAQTLAAGTLALALSDWIDERLNVPAPSVPIYHGEDPEVAAVAVRSEWGLGEKPVRNVIHLLESHGVKVYSVAEDLHEFDAFSFWRRSTPYIFLNNMKSAERSRMDAAHELGHLVLHSRGGARGREAEHQANMFASAFLMPRGGILAGVPTNGSLRQLIQAKRQWTVSLVALVYRMRKLGLLTDWRYRMLFVEIGKRGYRTNEPDGAPSESSQILTKVFGELQRVGLSMAGIAKELLITPAELNSLVFGLVLTQVAGSVNRVPAGTTSPVSRAPVGWTRPALRLLR